MTCEEAKSIINNTYIQFGRAQGKTLFLKAMKVAIQAIDKQIPSKVKLSLKGTTDWNTRCRCPSCGNYIFDSQKYCAECGQRIDWGDEK